MLYITTFSDKDAYTAHRTLQSDRAPDGGLFVPFFLPTYENAYIESLITKSFGEIVAEIMNLFFSCRLNGWDIDFCIGKNPIKINSMNHKVTFSELWHNHESKYSYIEKALYTKICPNQPATQQPTEWFCIAVRISVLFAVFSELFKQGITDFTQLVDISVPTGDFAAPISAWYARKMGLPVGTIICSCEDNSYVWDLIQRGEVNTGNCAQPEGLQRLIQGALGYDEVIRYRAVCENGSVYSLDDENINLINSIMFSAVIGKERIPAVINSIYRTSQYVIDENTALAYAGLQDYRTRVSNGHHGVLLAYDSPDLCIDTISKATGVPKSDLQTR